MATGTDHGSMDDKHRNILRRCKGTLVKDMEPDEVLLQMVDPLLFTTEDENKIKSGVTRQQQCETLLEMLQRKGAKAYGIFKKTLENVHPHLARTIVEAENKELNFELKLERKNSADLRRRLEYTKVKQGTPTDDELEKLGMDIGDIWVKLGRRLEVCDTKQKEIDKAHKLLSDKAYYTLKHWKQSKGGAANYQALCDALQDRCVQRQDLVEKYCYIKGMDTGTRPPAMGRVEPSGPIQAEQVPFTVMDTGTQAEHLKTLESKIVDAVKHLKDVEGKCKDVENSFNEKQEELKAVEAKGKEAENLLERKQDELRTVEAKSRDVEYRLERKQEELRTVEAKSRDVEYRLERKQEELKTVEGKYKDEENRLKEKQEERKTVEAKGRDVEYRLEKKQEELRDVEGKYKDEENRFKKKQEELKAVEAQCKDVENRFKKKQEDLKDVQRKCKDEENRFKEKQEALNKSRHIHNCGKKSKYTKKTKRNTRALATMPLKVDTAGVTTKLNEQEQNSLLERITSFAKAGLEYFPLTKDKNLKKFCTYLTDSIQIHLTGKQAGSLILSVHCRTLEILEQLWQDYSSGHLDSVVKECFLTDETTIGLETTISEKEYLRCKEFLTDISGLESLTDDESVAMENIKYKNILLKFYVLLLEKLDPNEVSVQLLTAGVLTSGDKEKVEEKPSQREKSEELLMILATKGPRGYEEFVKALEKNHCFLACQLLKEEKENLLYEVREREWLLNETMSDLLLEEERAITAASENEMLKTQLEKEKNPASQKKAVTLVEIARMMEDLESSWRQLATALELGEANLCKIRKENKTDREKAYAVLTMWTDKEGEDATVERLIDTLEKIAKSRPVEKMPGSEEIRDEEVEVNRLLKKTKDEISVENRKKEATRESSAEAALKELGIQLPEEEDEDEQKEVAKLLKEVNDEISVENRKKEGRKDTSLEAASVKELTNQPQEASSQEGKKPKRKVYKKKAMAS